MDNEFLKDKRERKPRTTENVVAEPAYTETRELNWEERPRAPKRASRGEFSAERAPRREFSSERGERGPRKEFTPRERSGGQPKDDNIVFGLRPVIEAIETEKQIEKIYVRKGAEGGLMADLKDLCYRSRIRYQEVPVEKLNRLTRGNHQGVVAVIAPIEYVGLEDILDRIPEDEKPLIVVFDEVTDVRNFGAIARSAECAGAHGLITPLKNSAPVNGEAIRSSAGALTRIPVHRAGSIRNTLKTLAQAGMQIVAATEKADTILFDADLTKPTVIVMGNEETGISKEVLKLCDCKAAIPMVGRIESLNVSAAAAIMLFETVRQRYCQQ